MTIFTSLLNNTFTVERRVRTSDGQGGWEIGYGVVGTIEGRIRPASSEERTVAQREERDVSHVLYCLPGEDIARGDRVTCGALTVEVLGVREPSLAGEHVEIDCLEVQAETTEVGS